MNQPGASAGLLSGIVILLTMLISAPHSASAQTRFELNAPSLNRTSQALLSDRELRIVDQEGRETVYVRIPDLDSGDGQFLAFRNSGAEQVIRWPLSNSGPMQIGSNVGGRYDFRASQMQVRPINGQPSRRPGEPLMPRANRLPGSAGDLVLPPGAAQPVNQSEFFSQVLRQKQPQPQVLRLSIRDDRGRDWYLGNSGNNRLAMHGAPNPAVADWYIVPAGRGYVRLGQAFGPDWLALAATPNRSLVFEPLGQNANQLWRVMQTSVGNGYWLESAVVPGFALTGAVNGSVSLLPISGAFGQVWLPQPIAVDPGFEPLWRTVSHDVRPNPPLPPARIELVNSHSSALRILVADRRSNAIREVRIEPSSMVVVPFDRDAGATVVETYEIRGPSGLWDKQQFVTQIPAAGFYDLSVYEEFLQSIAIDRTGTSPNPIEDVNYQPKSIGWLPLPPGNALPERGQIDAFQDAKAANNPGAVRRFDPKSLEKPSTAADPLKTILENATPPRQKF